MSKSPLRPRLTAPFPTLSARGVVASDHPIASQVGARMLAKGGNAVDAAVAVSLTLGAVCPYYTGIGGGGFALVWLPGWAEPRCLDFREVAPASARPDMFKSGLSSILGGGAVGVPGCLAGWSLLHREFGVLPWKDILNACAEACEVGFPIDPNYLRITISKIDDLHMFQELSRVFLCNHQPPIPNHWLRNADLAKCYSLLAQNGAGEFYEGEMAEKIVAAARGLGGGLTMEDMAGYRPLWRPVLPFSYRGKKGYTVGPPSAGGMQLAQMCTLLENFPLNKPGSGHDLHLLTEAMKISFYERANWVSDPAFCQVPTDWLLDKERLNRWAEKISDKAALALPDEMATRIPVGGTASFTAATFDGGVVMATESVNLWWGSMIVPPGLGFPLNNVMDDFACHPGLPDAFGLFSSEVNQVEPGKRPASSSTPALIFENGRPILATGSAGGPRIPTSVAHILVNRLDYGMNAQQAISAARVHHQWKPDVVLLEPQICSDVQRELLKRGHQVLTEECRSHACAATLDWDEKMLAAAADFRAFGAAHGI